MQRLLDARQIKGAIERPHLVLDMGREYGGAVMIETWDLDDAPMDGTMYLRILHVLHKKYRLSKPRRRRTECGLVGYPRDERMYASRSRHVGRLEHHRLVCAFYRGPPARGVPSSSAVYELPFAKDVPRYTQICR